MGKEGVLFYSSMKFVRDTEVIILTRETPWQVGRYAQRFKGREGEKEVEEEVSVSVSVSARTCGKRLRTFLSPSTTVGRE